MQADRSTTTTGRFAALAQAGLAALVAGSLLSFSTIAFRTAFDDPATSRGIAVSAPRTAPSAPVVLPTPADARTEQIEVVVTEPQTPTIVVDAPDDAVLGTRAERPNRTRKNDRDKNDRRPRKWSFPQGGRTLSGYRGGSRDDSEDDGHKHTVGKGHEKAIGKGHQMDHDADDDGRARGRSKNPHKEDRPKKGKKH